MQERVAIKRIKPIFRDEWEARHTLREITIMRLCEQHPNVICLRGLSLNESEDELYIVMECMFSDLHRIIKHVRPLNVGQIKVILKQILTGLEALHSIGVIHRDLKPVGRWSQPPPTSYCHTTQSVKRGWRADGAGLIADEAERRGVACVWSVVVGFFRATCC